MRCFESSTLRVLPALEGPSIRYVNLTSDVCGRLAGTTAPTLRGRTVARSRRRRIRLSSHTPRRIALTRWARDNLRLPVKTTSYRPQTPASVTHTNALALAAAIEISGRKPLSPRTPLRLQNPKTARQGGILRPSRLSPRDSPGLAAQRPFRRKMRRTQKLLLVDTLQALAFRYRLKSSEKLAPFVDPRRLAFHDAGPRFGRFACCLTRNERCLLVRAPRTKPLTPLSIATSDYSGAFRAPKPEPSTQDRLPSRLREKPRNPRPKTPFIAAPSSLHEPTSPFELRRPAEMPGHRRMALPPPSMLDLCVLRVSPSPLRSEPGCSRY